MTDRDCIFCFKTSKVATGDAPVRRVFMPRLDGLPRAEPSASHRGSCLSRCPSCHEVFPRCIVVSTPTRSQGNPPARGHASWSPLLLRRCGSITPSGQRLGPGLTTWRTRRLTGMLLRNIIVAQCRARDRATVHWRNMGRKLRARAAHAYRADSWVRKAREERVGGAPACALQLEQMQRM